MPAFRPYVSERAFHAYSREIGGVYFWEISPRYCPICGEKLNGKEGEVEMDTTRLDQWPADMMWRISKGNPGAMRFLVEAIAVDEESAIRGFSRMWKAGIAGDKLYMLWNDCCERDTARAIRAMTGMDIDNILTKINYSQGRGIPIRGDEVEG